MAFDYYFVSVTDKYSEDLILKLNANCLFSYLVDKKSLEKFINYKRAGVWSGKLMVDNGAYTMWKRGGEIDIDEYIKFLNDNFDCIDFAIALDKIPDLKESEKSRKETLRPEEETYLNYLYMKDRIKYPDRLLPVFHNADPYEYLEKYLEFDDISYICIAGVTTNTSARNLLYKNCFEIIQRSKHPNIKVHGLGNSRPEIVTEFPFTSIDATSWKLFPAMGRIVNRYGDIYVGTKGDYDALPDSLKDEIQQTCKECGIDNPESLIDKYSSRALYTMYELFHLSQVYEPTSKVFSEQLKLF